jgi:hypothetical protein
MDEMQLLYWERRVEITNDVLQVGILEPKYRVNEIKQQVVKADSAAKSLIPPSTTHSQGAST